MTKLETTRDIDTLRQADTLRELTTAELGEVSGGFDFNIDVDNYQKTGNIFNVQNGSNNFQVF